MLALLQKTGRAGVAALNRPLSRVFSHAENPMNHLGSLTIFFCWIVLISGIWLTIFFRTSISGAFESLEYLSREQWYLGGIMRSLHRYASDAAILLLLLHVFKEFSFDRYRPKRWFSWVTGLPLVWILFPLGITGYWLVWDQLAQYVAITSAEMLDSLPFFTDSMAGNFLSDASLSDRFFTLMAFLHLIGLPIFLVFGIWLHVFRLSGPKINPPRRLMAGTLIALLLLSLVFPAQSQQQADMALAPQVLQLDWFYLHAYPLVQLWSPGWVWLALIGISALIMLAPWLPPARRERPAVVSLDNCNGCQRCADDCPYAAIQMAPRSDGTNYLREAVVDPDLCVSCGICVGACPTASPFRTRSALVPGIDLPLQTASELREQIDAVSAQHPEAAKVMVFACRGSRDARVLASAGEPLVEVQCMGQIPPSYLDYVLSRGKARGIFMAGCTDQGCHYRLGADWTEQRIGRSRDPQLRKRIDTESISLAWANSPDGKVLQRLEAFRSRLDDSGGGAT